MSVFTPRGCHFCRKRFVLGWSQTWVTGWESMKIARMLWKQGHWCVLLSLIWSLANCRPLGILKFQVSGTPGFWSPRARINWKARLLNYSGAAFLVSQMFQIEMITSRSQALTQVHRHLLPEVSACWSPLVLFSGFRRIVFIPGVFGNEMRLPSMSSQALGADRLELESQLLCLFAVWPLSYHLSESQFPHL